MTVKIEVNKEKQEVLIYHNGIVIEQLTGINAYNFLEDAEKQSKENKFFFQPITKITIEDIEESGCPLNELTGLNFDPTIYYRCFPEAHMSVGIMKNGEVLDYIYLDENFTKEQLHFGPITNHHIRACLDEELIEHILDTPKFRMGIDTPYNIFDEENTYYYTSDESSDT